MKLQFFIHYYFVRFIWLCLSSFWDHSYCKNREVWFSLFWWLWILWVFLKQSQTDLKQMYINHSNKIPMQLCCQKLQKLILSIFMTKWPSLAFITGYHMAKTILWAGNSMKKSPWLSIIVCNRLEMNKTKSTGLSWIKFQSFVNHKIYSTWKDQGKFYQKIWYQHFSSTEIISKTV